MGRWAASLALALPPALLIQIAAGSLRNPRLNPLLRLRPGRYDHYTIERLDIPMREGHLPALHVVPRGGAAAVVCVLHGSGCDKTSYAWRLVDTLVERGLALLLIDMDGHGENPRAQSFPAITEDADVAVAWLRERYTRVGLLGVSLGGCVAARAVADGVAVDALVVLEAPPLLRYTQADVYREAIALARPYLLDIFNDCTAQALIKAWEYPPIRAADQHLGSDRGAGCIGQPGADRHATAAGLWRQRRDRQAGPGRAGVGRAARRCCVSPGAGREPPDADSDASGAADSWAVAGKDADYNPPCLPTDQESRR